MSTGRLRVIFDADIGPDPTDFTDRACARKATRVVLTVFGLYHAGAVRETMDPEPSYRWS